MPGGRPKKLPNRERNGATVKRVEHVKALIDTRRILKTLQDHMFGEKKLSTTQIRAAEILLKKVMPDLAAIQANVKHEFEVNWADRLIQAYQGDGDSEKAKSDGLH